MVCDISLSCLQDARKDLQNLQNHYNKSMQRYKDSAFSFCLSLATPLALESVRLFNPNIPRDGLYNLCFSGAVFLSSIVFANTVGNYLAMRFARNSVEQAKENLEKMTKDYVFWQNEIDRFHLRDMPNRFYLDIMRGERSE